MRLLRPLLLAVSLLAALPPAGSGQEDAPLPLDGRRLRMGVDSMIVYHVDSAGRATELGWMRDELRTVRHRGEPLLRRVFEAHAQGFPFGVDTITDRLRTLAPVRHVRHAERDDAWLDFAPGRITGRAVWGRDLGVDVQVERQTFYNGYSLDLVLRAADLAEGWSAVVPAYVWRSSQLALHPVRVVGVEVVDGVACWVVDARVLGNPVTYWIEQDTRHMRQQVVRRWYNAWYLIRSVGFRER